MKLFHVVPEREQVVVHERDGREIVVNGPARISKFGRTITPCAHRTIPDGERGILFDAHGKRSVVVGPCFINIHPDGSYVPDTRYDLKPYEVCFVLRETPNQEEKDLLRQNMYMVHGAENPRVWINPEIERVVEFKWTGGGDADGYGKQPGALRFTMMRMQPSPSYFALDVMTKDRTTMRLCLLIEWEITEPWKAAFALDDVLGSFYNRIMTDIRAYVALLTQDALMERTDEVVKAIQLFTSDTGREYFYSLGIKVHSVQVRNLRPESQVIQKIWDNAAVLNTQRLIDDAEHERKMKKIEHERIELAEEATLGALKDEAAKQEGKRSALTTIAMEENLRWALGAKFSDKLMLLRAANQADKFVLRLDSL